MAVRLSDIVDALQMQFDETPSFLDLETGQVVTVPLDLIRAAEEVEYEDDEGKDDKSEPDEEWEFAKRAAFLDRVKKLPTTFDVHEWAIMEEFSESVESDRTRDDLLSAIHGSGAFRYFKDSIQRYGIEKDWYRFRDQALRRIAIDWCEENDIQWKE
jgi:Uncharacterised protein family (UPF0158)